MWIEALMHYFISIFSAFFPFELSLASLLSSTCSLVYSSLIPFRALLRLGGTSKKRRHRPRVHKATAKVGTTRPMQPRERAGFCAAQGRLFHRALLGPRGRVQRVIHDAHSQPTAEGLKGKTDWALQKLAFHLGDPEDQQETERVRASHIQQKQVQGSLPTSSQTCGI